MKLLEDFLEVKTSNLPGAGNGLFATRDIKKSERIIEYTGKVTSWKNVNHMDFTNPYIFYITRNNVIDALEDTNSLARYVNDARGLQKIKGLTNNAEYVIEKGRAFVHATKRIPAGTEILVAYGKEYWDVIKINNYLDQQKNKDLK